jgi:hypothetical protein
VAVPFGSKKIFLHKSGDLSRRAEGGQGLGVLFLRPAQKIPKRSQKKPATLPYEGLSRPLSQRGLDRGLWPYAREDILKILD